MNFLAHIYLSGNSENLIVGNFIADSIRKSQEKQYSKELLDGIYLHRFIDDFTDHHSIVKASRDLLFPTQSKYALVLTDIFYDHFLARDWSKWHKSDLKVFSKNFHRIMQENWEVLPERIQYMLPYMKRGQWMYNYQFMEGMDSVLKGMSRRAHFNNKMNLALADLKEHYEIFDAHFQAFFPELKSACEEFISNRDQA